MTVRPHLRRRTLAVGAGALCLSLGASGAAPADPAFVPGDDPADHPGMPGRTVTVAPQPRGDTPADHPGMPGGPIVVAEPRPSVPDGGFDWLSAAVGAGGAGVLIVLSLGGASYASGVRVRVVRS